MIKIRIIFEFKRHKFNNKKKKAFVFSPEAIELNITKCTFLQSRAGQYEQLFISLYFWAFAVYGTYLGILYLD